ncbi:sialate O-acetylesterase [Polaribacter sp.]|jgi:sialate O-acetylesterase|uniref:sialate O-acetylesterase n=1 Tax=Polaribacter sp. TaxID=1920175 RepID=UPI004047E155
MLRKSVLSFIVILSFGFQSIAQKKPLRLNALFSDHMVLQQNANVAFWGSSSTNEKVIVSGSWGKFAEITSDENGQWKLYLPTPKAGGPFTVNISTSTNKEALEDVMVGEVWLASGQSNMEMPLMGWPPNDIINNAEEEIAKSNYPEIRMFTVERQLSLEPKATFNGKWKVCSPETSGNFSASAYFFARKLHKELNVPIGIIHSSWGGTPAESWTSKKTIDTFNEFKSVTQSINTSDLFKNELKWFSQFKAIGIPTNDEQWVNLNLLDNLIVETSYNDSDWEEIQLPGRYDNHINGGEFNGAVWFRKNIVIDNLDSDYILTIGAVDDMDETYVNGHKIGGLIGMGFWNKKREFKIPKSILKKGNNTIAVRAIDAEDVGEIIGPMTLSNDNNIKVSLNGNWKYKLIAEIYNNKFYLYGINNIDFNSRIKTIKLNSGAPTVLYNGMINPLVPYTIKGVIWYQGEANVGRADQYENLFPAMIRDWREKWNYDFPFYYVQIAPYQYNINKDSSLDQSQELREAQRNSLKTKNTGMVVTMDIGNFNNIHPSNKQDIGSRLARLALSNNYSINIVPSGPIFNGLKVIGSKLILEFENPGSRLISKGDLLGFEIAGADKKYVFANATIINNQVELYSDKIKNPLYARYAWKDKAVPSLFNLEGLPASSFTTLEQF